jgi:hypothetical protein
MILYDLFTRKYDSVIGFDRERPILNLDKQLKKCDESDDYGIIINYLI